MFLATALVAQLSAAGLPLGVLAPLASGPPCVALPAPLLAAGAVVTLVRADLPQTVVTAMVDSPVSSCAALERAMIAGPYYRLRGVSSLPGDASIWIAFRGKVATRSTRSGRVVSVNKMNPNVRIRSCTSSEGLHLTAWAGQPLTSQRLWHQYFYLGYDVEPSCQDADTRSEGEQ